MATQLLEKTARQKTKLICDAEMDSRAGSSTTASPGRCRSTRSPTAYFFSTGTAWGVATIADDDVKLDVRSGRLDVTSIFLRGRRLPSVGV